MRRANILALLALGVMAALAVYSQADALQTTKAYKEEFITIVVTPSPTPLAMHWPMRQKAGEPARAVAVAPQVAKLVADPYAGPAMLAMSPSTWDVPPSSMMIAQTTSAQATPVPVRFNAKADPNGLYLKLIPSSATLTVPYGVSVWPCVFQIMTYYTTAYQLSDWAYGTVSSGSGSFPMENYPTTSYLAWRAPDFATTWHNYANSGTPGEKVWSGTAGQNQTHCIDLQVTVPNSQPPGTYSAIAQYTLIVN